MKEWNVSACKTNSYGELEESLFVFSSFWKVVRWFLLHGKKHCEIYIWTSWRY